MEPGGSQALARPAVAGGPSWVAVVRSLPRVVVVPRFPRVVVRGLPRVVVVRGEGGALARLG